MRFEESEYWTPIERSTPIEHDVLVSDGKEFAVGYFDDNGFWVGLPEGFEVEWYMEIPKLPAPQASEVERR